MRKGWFDALIKKYRDEGMDPALLDKMRDEAMHEMPAEAFSSNGSGGDGDTHVHVHLPSKNTDDDDEPAPVAGNGGGMSGDAVDPVAFQKLCDKVATLEAAVLGDEEEVELEDQDTQDKRRFKLRRRDAIKKTRDEEPPVPDTAPEMMGDTDLPGTEDLNKRTTGDSAALEPIWHAAIAAAEIIVPGFRMPTFDAAHRAGLTAKRLCAFRRGVMVDALKNDDVAKVVRRFVGDASVPRMQCDALKIAFNATADAIKGGGTSILRASAGDHAGGGTPPKVPTLSEMNANATKFWDGKGGAGNGAVRH